MYSDGRLSCGWPGAVHSGRAILYVPLGLNTLLRETPVRRINALRGGATCLMVLFAVLTPVAGLRSGPTSGTPGARASEEQPANDGKKGLPEKRQVLKLTATVDGYTQATEFNPQKYPFKYTGSSQLDAAQVKVLGTVGDVPADVTKALLGCLLWPKEGDSLEKAALKSDGKKLTGAVEVLHKYGKQGAHTLKLELEGSVEDGKVTLKVVESSVSGTWNSGFAVKLGGAVKVTIEVESP